MVHDDDTGRHAHNKLWGPEDSGDPDDSGALDEPDPHWRPPSPEVAQTIIRFAGITGWNVERIHAWFRTPPNGRNDITYATIRRVIARARAQRLL
jgi:hypothetical protein